MNRSFFFRRQLRFDINRKVHSFLFIGAMLFTLLFNIAFAQTEVQNLAVVLNALDKDDWNITSSLSIIDYRWCSKRYSYSRTSRVYIKF